MLGAQLPLASALPFVALLAAIAVLPLVAPRWWHPNGNKAIVAVAVSLPVLWQLGIAFGQPGRAELAEMIHDYVGFIVVIGALFVITGGIHVQGSLSGTPLVNTGMLGLGAVLANLLGTTGASVLLIRPLLRANRSRRRTAHIVVFFIFLVANCAGLLTPVLCGSSFKNKGVQPLLDAVLDYLPSPLDVPSIEGEPMSKGGGIGEGEKIVRHPDDSEPFAALAFKIAADPFVGKLAYFRVYSGRLSSGARILN